MSDEACCALKHTCAQQFRTSLFVMWTAGCRSMLLRKCIGEEGLALAAGGGRARGEGGGVHVVFVVFGCWKTSFHAFISAGCCVLFTVFLDFDTHATLIVRWQMDNNNNNNTTTNK